MDFPKLSGDANDLVRIALFTLPRPLDKSHMTHEARLFRNKYLQERARGDATGKVTAMTEGGGERGADGRDTSI